jgi:hypothetical protein
MSVPAQAVVNGAAPGSLLQREVIVARRRPDEDNPDLMHARRPVIRRRLLGLSSIEVRHRDLKPVHAILGTQGFVTGEIASDLQQPFFGLRRRGLDNFAL